MRRCLVGAGFVGPRREISDRNPALSDVLSSWDLLEGLPRPMPRPEERHAHYQSVEWVVILLILVGF